MDASNQNSNPTVPTNQADPAEEPVVVPVQPTPPVAPPGVVGGPHKESAPVAIDTIKPAEAQIRPSESEPQLHPEVKAAGVEVSKNAEVPTLTYEDKQAGLAHAKEVTPVVTEPRGAVNMPFPSPMTITQADEVIKTDKNTSDSKLWLSTLVRKVFQQFNLTQKKTA